MILLDDVVQVTSRPNFHALPPTIFVVQQPQAAVRRAVAIDVDLLRPGHAALADGRAEKRSGRLHAAITAEQRRDRLPVLIHRSIQVVPPAPDRHCGLVHAPGRPR